MLLSVLLGTDPPRLPVALLVRTTDLFGIAEGTTRTALSRMASAGEVRAADGWYEIAADNLLARQARQSASRAGSTRRWDGGWLQAVVDAAGRRPAADRARLRSALTSARLAELREGVWMRPANLDASPTTREGAPELDDVRWFDVGPVVDAVALANRLWDLRAWSAAARRLRREMDDLVTPLQRGDRDALAPGFVLSAAVLRHFQADPLLPGELVGDDWPGDELRGEYDAYDRAYRAVLADWFASQ